VVSIVVSMCVVLAVSVVIVVYVAFPHRGEALPALPWLGEAMRKGADALPTIEDAEGAELVDDLFAGAQNQRVVPPPEH
jgi:hypothetical protein